MVPPATSERNPFESIPEIELPLPGDVDGSLLPIDPSANDDLNDDLFDQLDPANDPALKNPNVDAVPDNEPKTTPSEEDLFDFGARLPHKYFANSTNAIRSIQNRRDSNSKQQAAKISLVPVHVKGSELDPTKLDGSVGARFSSQDLLPPDYERKPAENAQRPNVVKQAVPKTANQANQYKLPLPPIARNQVVSVSYQETTSGELTPRQSNIEQPVVEEHGARNLVPISGNPLRGTLRPLADRKVQNSSATLEKSKLPPTPPKLKPVKVSATVGIKSTSRRLALPTKRSMRSTLRENPLR